MTEENNIARRCGSMDVAKRTGQYIQLRDWVKAEEEKFKLRIGPAKEEMAKIEGELAEFMRQTGQNNGSTPQGSFYTSTKYSATIEDKTAFGHFVMGQGNLDLVDIRANASAVADFAKEHGGQTPPGVTLKPVESVHVNRPRK